MDELREVSARPKVIAKLHLVTDRIELFLASLEIAATLLDGFPSVFAYQRDPDDAHYVDLAVATSADFIVSRDNDLLDLMNATKPEASEFLRICPSVRIVSPVEFLRECFPDA